MKFDHQTTGIVITDPQVEFLSPQGKGYELTKEILAANHTIENLERLLKACKEKGYPVFVSPHVYYPHDHKWQFGGGGETMMLENKMFDHKSQFLPIPSAAGADFLDVFKPYLEDGETVVTSPHKIFGPETNDLVLQLRKRGIQTVLLAGMNANLCVDSHMRELTEQGFTVYVVYDATGAPGDDAFQAGMTNFKFISSGVFTTSEILEQMD